VITSGAVRLGGRKGFASHSRDAVDDENETAMNDAA
jgi:hypothetical protein